MLIGDTKKIMKNHLANLTGISLYKVRLAFTERYEPASLSGEGLPYVSLENEIEANTLSQKGQDLREKYGRIPYGSPIYLWESESDGKTEVLYVGQTMLLSLQKRFEGHASVVKLLADHVNTNDSKSVLPLSNRYPDCSAALNQVMGNDRQEASPAGFAAGDQGC